MTTIHQQSAMLVSLAALQAENLQREYIKKSSVKRDLWLRLISTLTRLNYRRKLDINDRERLAGAFNEMGDENAIVNLVDDRLYVNGLFDVKGLSSKIVW